MKKFFFALDIVEVYRHADKLGCVETLARYLLSFVLLLCLALCVGGLLGLLDAGEFLF